MADGQAMALISWIDGACVDELPHAEIRAAIDRWKDRQPRSSAYLRPGTRVRYKPTGTVAVLSRRKVEAEHVADIPFHPGWWIDGETRWGGLADFVLDDPDGNWEALHAGHSGGQVLHGVECYEAWRAETDCPHEAPSCTCGPIPFWERKAERTHFAGCPLAQPWQRGEQEVEHG